MPNRSGIRNRNHREDPCGGVGMKCWLRFVRSKVRPERYQHVLRVVRLAHALASAHRFSAADRDRTVLAAVLHDVARDLPAAELMHLAPPSNDAERRHPLMLHGRAGRALAARRGVRDPRVLAAIESHVHGPKDHDPVAMALYVADVSEPGRGVNDDVRALARRDLERAYAHAVAVKVRYLRSCGKPIHPVTLQVHDALVHRSS